MSLTALQVAQSISLGPGDGTALGTTGLLSLKGPADIPAGTGGYIFCLGGETTVGVTVSRGVAHIRQSFAVG